jgi:prepilin-type N-terminal cleavage/methylation domain-containing protein
MEFKHTSTKRFKAGFTLIEMLVTAGLGTIVLLGAMTFYIFSLSSFSSLTNFADMNNQSRNASDIISRDIRCAPTVANATSTQLQLRAPDGTNVVYTYDPAMGTLTRTKGNDTQVILKQAQSFAFTLYQRPTNSTTAYEQFPVSSPANAKIVAFQWLCNRKVATAKTNSESMQTAMIALRNE